MRLWPFGRRARKPRYTIRVVANDNVTIVGAWTVYAGVKAMRRMGEMEPQGPGLDSPFDEECHARDATGEFWAVQPEEKRRADAHLQLLADVRAAGFIREYVWRFLREPAWPDPGTLRLEPFDAWRAEYGLPDDHKPPTLAFAAPA